MSVDVRAVLGRLAYPLGGLAFGVAVVVAFELLLRMSGAAEGGPRWDPFAGFSRAVPVFEPASREDGSRVYRVSAARRNPAAIPGGSEPQREFQAEKPPGGYRVFVIGGSSSAGSPYGTRYAFSWWIEQRLRAELPGASIEVVNAAFPGYASRRLLPVAIEIARHEPDLLVVYMGHNEWAERVFYAHLLEMDPRLFRLLEWVYGTRIYAVASQLVEGSETEPGVPEIEDDFDQWAGQMFATLRERASGLSYPSERELAYRDLLYENNLRQIAEVVGRAGSELMFLTLTQNFSDWPPPASRHRTDLKPDERAEWEAHFEVGSRRSERGQCEEALAAYARALAIDDRHADLHYRTATCERRLGHLDRAWHHYRRASDLDPVPQGAPTYFNDVLRRVARSVGATLVDVDAIFARASGPRLVGYDLFTDFAHPNVRAHQIIAAAVVEAMRENDLPPGARWRVGAYEEPEAESIYAAQPQLRTRELLSRVLVCLVSDRIDCEDEARRLLQLEPDNRVAKEVLARLGAKAPE